MLIILLLVGKHLLTLNAIPLRLQNATTGLLPNAYNPTENPFDDAASSALIVSAAYRLASLGVLTDEQKTIAIAESIRKAIQKAINKETGW